MLTIDQLPVQDAPSYSDLLPARDVSETRVPFYTKRMTIDELLHMAPLGNSVPVRQYGAVGDGATDDTLAITNAIAAAGANGMVVLEPGKTYKTSSVITVGYDNVTIWGYGSTVTSAGDTQYRKFRFSGRIGGRVFGVKFNCGYVSATFGIGLAVVEIVASTDVTVRDCQFNEIAQSGVCVIGASQRCAIESNQFYKNFCAIFVDDDTVVQPTRISITGNIIRTGLSSANLSGGVKISGIGTVNSHTGNIISDNIMDSPGQMGVEIQGYVNGVSIQGNTITGAGFGISLSVVSKCAVFGNTVKASTTYGIELAGATLCTVVGNSSDGTNTAGTVTTDRGIQSSDSSANCTVSANQVTAGSIYIQNSTGFVIVGNHLNDGSVILHGTDRSTVTGNTIVGVTVANGVTINVSAGSGTKQGYVISNNIFSGTFAFSIVRIISTSGSCAVAGVIISGNSSSGATGNGTAFDMVLGGSTTTVSNLQLFNNVANANNGFHQDWLDIPIRETSSSETVDPRYNVIIVDATAGAKNQTLPDAAQNYGRSITVKKSDSSGNAVTVIGTIDNAANYSLASQNKYVTVKSENSKWWVVANN